jgi:rubrerythrin
MTGDQRPTIGAAEPASPAQPATAALDEFAAERPGDPACLLRRVCQACGSVADEDPPTMCPTCGSELTAD